MTVVPLETAAQHTEVWLDSVWQGDSVPSGVTFNLRMVFLVALMIASLAAAVSGALQRLFPGWQPIYLVIVCFLIGLEAGTVH